MTEPLNYTTKAIDDLVKLQKSTTLSPDDVHGVGVLLERLRRAEVFVLPDHGQLLDRARPRPEVPGQCFKPPFPIVALEYTASEKPVHHPVYEAGRSSRRIALAWDAPSQKVGRSNDTEPVDGVFITSISYMDDLRMWVPMAGAAFIEFDCEYTEEPLDTTFRDEMIAIGRISRKVAASRSVLTAGVKIYLPSVFEATAQRIGMREAMRFLNADLNDELNAYTDMCIALSCNNIAAERHEQAGKEKLNRARIKAGKVPLKDFHVLKIAGAGDEAAFGGGSHGGVRSHLRRGHVRRLGPDRITWVNACMVRGSRAGFVDKVYTIEQRP